MLSSFSRQSQLTAIRLHALLRPAARAIAAHPCLSAVLLLSLVGVLLMLMSGAAFCILPPSIFFLLHPLSPTAPAWMDPRESALVLSVLQANSNVSMLEYGSGASSWTFSAHVAHYVSIEHDLQFCHWLVQEAQQGKGKGREVVIVRVWGEAKDSNFSLLYASPGATPLPLSSSSPLSLASPHALHIYCIPPNAPRTRDTSLLAACVCCFSTCPSSFAQFHDYVLAGQQLASRYGGFGIALIDGRARPQAAYHSIAGLWPGGGSRLIVHDWNPRPYYHVLVQRGWLEVVQQQVESEQLGGGGLVVLRARDGITGMGGAELDDLPDWW